MRSRAVVAGAFAAVAIAGLFAGWGLRSVASRGGPGAAAATPTFPGGHPIDAGLISTGRIAMERLPEQVTGALELHSAEIVKTAQALEAKQQRISGSCAPGSAIRVVGEDGSVVCQRLPRGVVSVSSLTAAPRNSSTGTAQGAVDGAVGRYQTAGDDDFLVAPVDLPDGAVVTSFSYTFYDADPRIDGAAYLYRSDDVPLAALTTTGASEEVRTVATESIAERRVDRTAHAYFVYFQLSGVAGARLMPVKASVAYRLP